jgi:hypothetical protein
MSAKKRTSLDAVFGVDELPPAEQKSKLNKRLKSEEPAKATAIEIAPKKRRGEPKRPNVKQHTAYLPLAVHEQLRRLAFEEDSKIHNYLVEGIDRVFANRGLPAIKDLS